VSAWNYHWREDYGSDDFRLSEWKPGRDRLEVLEAKLSSDGRAVFLAIRDMPACMQMQIQYNLRVSSGERARGELQSTVNVLGEAGAFAGRFDGGLPDPVLEVAPEPPPRSGGMSPMVALALPASLAGSDSGAYLRAFALELEEKCGARTSIVTFDIQSGAARLAPDALAADVLVLILLCDEKSGKLEALFDLRKPLVAINDPSRRFTYLPGKATVVTRSPEAAGHPLLRGVPIQFRAASPLAYVLPLAEGARPLLFGQDVRPDPADGKPVINPVAWIEDREGLRRFHTTLGAAADFQSEPFRRLLRNAVRWAAGE
jgi:hypothetical protein